MVKSSLAPRLEFAGKQKFGAIPNYTLQTVLVILSNG